MDSGFSSREGQEFLDMTYATEMEKGRFTNGRDMGVEGRGVIRDDAQVSGRWGWLDGGLTDGDGEASGGRNVFGMEKEEFCFAIFKLEAVKRHPVRYISDACLKFVQGLLLRRWDCHRRGITGYHQHGDDTQCCENG